MTAASGPAGGPSVKALAVFLQTVALDALAAREVALSTRRRVLSDAGLEGHGVLADGRLHRLHARGVGLAAVGAVGACAARDTEPSHFKAVTV